MSLARWTPGSEENGDHLVSTDPRTGGSEGTTSARISGLGVRKSRGSTDPLELWMYIFASFLVTYTLYTIYVHTCTCMHVWYLEETVDHAEHTLLCRHVQRTPIYIDGNESKHYYR